MPRTFHLFWNLTAEGILFLLFIGFLILLFFPLKLRARMLFFQRAKSPLPFSSPGPRILSVVSNALLQRRVLRSLLAGGIHALLFWAFLVSLVFHLAKLFPLLTGVRVSGTFGSFVFYGSRGAGIIAISALVLLSVRRYILRPEQFRGTRQSPATVFLLFLLFITGLAAAQLRSQIFAHPTAYPSAWLLLFHHFIFFCHFAFAMGLAANLPATSLFHALAAPANIYFRTALPKGALEALDLSTETERFGTGRISDLTKKSMLDLAACMGCGRCQAACPPYRAGAPLSPRNILLYLDEGAREIPRDRAEKKPEGCSPFQAGPLCDDALWACTACGACTEACPALIDPLEKVLGVRRNRVLDTRDFPSRLKERFETLEVWGNPWGSGKPIPWPADVAPPPSASGRKGELLLFAGCFGRFHERSARVLLSLVRILRNAGVSFSMLNGDEACCGAFVRRTGNEYLFQKLAQVNVERFQTLGIEKILTFCPHCFHTFKNEYPQLNGFFEVEHHTAFLARLLAESRIRPGRVLEDGCAYHDPCFLGRFSGIYEAPRQVLDILTGGKREELRLRKREGFCCGAGGGVPWVQEETSRKIARLRLSEMQNVRTNTLATACPMCLETLSEASNGAEYRLADLCELLDEAM